MSEQRGNDITEKKTQQESNRNSKVEKYHNWIKNSQDELSSKCEMGEGIISEHEDRSIEIFQSKEQKDKKISLREVKIPQRSEGQ